MVKKRNIYDSLASSAPILNEKARKQAQRAIDIQSSQAISEAPVDPSLNIRRAGQGVGASIQGARGQADQQVTQAGQEQLAALGMQAAASESADIQQDLTTRGIKQGEELAGKEQRQQLREQALTEKQRTEFSRKEIEQMQRMQERGLRVDSRMSFLTRRQREDLSELAIDADEKLFYSRLAFTDQQNQDKFQHEQQLADWMVTNAQEHEVFLDQAQEIEQAYQKEMVLYEATITRLKQALQQGFADNQQRLDQASRKRIQEAVAAMEKKKAERAADAEMVKTGITVATTVALAASDVNLKENISEDSGRLQEMFDNLKNYDYNYKDEKFGEGRKTSIMAQDLEKSEMGREAVIDTHEGKMVDYSKLLPAMFAANVDSNERIRKLEAAIEAMKKESK